MKTYQIVGRLLHHLARPRCTIQFNPRGDGSGAWDGEVVEWIDQPTPPAPALAKLMRDCGDYFAAHCRRDWLQDAVIERAAALQRTAYSIARDCGWAVSEDHVRDYLRRRKSMGSHKLQHVLRVLGLGLADQ